METKKYSSFAQIDADLEILKVTRALHLQKIVLSVQKTKESLSAKNSIKGFFGDYTSLLFNYSGIIMRIGIPLLIQWFIKRKRGD